MKRRTLLVFFAVVATVGVIAISGALWWFTRPTVQRELALDALRSAGWSGDIREVSVGLGGDFRASDAALAGPGGETYACKSLAGKFSVWAALTGGIQVESIRAEGLALDLSKRLPGPPQTPAPKKEESAGSFPRVRVVAADFSGKVTTGSGSGDFTARIRDLDTDSGGAFAYTVVMKDALIAGDATLRLAAPLPAGGSLAARLAAAAPKISANAEVRKNAASPPVASVVIFADETHATVGLAAGKGSGKLRIDLDPTGAAASLAGDFTLDRTAFEVWAPGLGKEFSAKGKITGKCDFEGPVSMEASVEASSPDSPFGAAGPDRVSLYAKLAGDVKKKILRLGSFRAGVASASAPNALVIDASGIRVADGKPSFESAGSVVALKLTSLPVAWAGLFSPIADIVPTGALSGEMRASREGEGDAFAVDCGEGLVASGITLRLPGFPALKGVSAKIPAKLRFAEKGPFELSSDGATLASGGEEVLSVKLNYKGHMDGPGASVGEISAKFSPGVLPPGFLPGGVCEFSKDTGMRLAASALVEISGEKRLVKTARLDASDRAGAPLLGVALARPLDPNGIPADGAPLATFAFRGAPLGLFNPLLGGAKLAGLAEGGDLAIARTAAGWSVSRPDAGAPASVLGLSWTNAAGEVVLAPTDASGTLTWESAGDGWKLALGKILFANASGPALVGDLSLTRDATCLSGEGDFTGKLAALAKSLPALAARGVVSGDYAVKIATTADGGNADIRIQNLMTTAGGAPRALSLAAKFSDKAGVRELTAPITLSGPSGETHLAVGATGRKTATGRDWIAGLSGGTLFADDWIPLLSTAKGAAGSAAAKPAAPLADTAPAWAGVTGKFTFALDAIRVAGESVDKPRAVMVVTPEKVVVSDAGASWRGVPATAEATILFTPKTPKLYGLKMTGLVKDASFATLTGAFAPGANGWLDGKLDAHVEATGSAENPGALASALTLAVKIDGRDGTLRLLSADNETARRAGDLGGLVGDLAAGVGRIVEKTSPDAGRALNAVATIRTALGAMRYQNLSASVRLTPDGALDMPAADIFNDALRLRFTAKIAPGKDTPFGARDASVEARIDGKGVLGDALKLIAPAAADASGWITGPSLRHDGPLDKLRDNLAQSLVRALTPKVVPTPVRDAAGAGADIIGKAFKGLGL